MSMLSSEACWKGRGYYILSFVSSGLFLNEETLSLVIAGLLFL